MRRVFGLMMGAGGAGALAGSLATGLASGYRRQGALLMGAALGMALLVVLFGQSRLVWLSLLFLVGAGLCGGMLQVLTMSILQSLVPDEYRGRRGSLDILIWGLMPLGTVADRRGRERGGSAAGDVGGGRNRIRMPRRRGRFPAFVERAKALAETCQCMRCVGGTLHGAEPACIKDFSAKLFA